MSAPARQWFTPAELAELALPGLPGSARAIQLRAGRENWQGCPTPAGQPGARRREGRGGGWEYHYSILPRDAAAAILRRYGIALVTVDPQKAAAKKPADKSGDAELAGWFNRLPERQKAMARRRLEILGEVEALIGARWAVHDAVARVAALRKVGRSTLHDWRRRAGSVAPEARLAALAPRHAGRTATVECDPRAWEMLKADWLRQARPSFSACYERLQAAAAEHGWTIPSARTLRRRLEREVPRAVAVLARQGSEALKRLYPAQERDRSIFHALEAVNADGHRFDVFVRWPDGTVARPVMLAIQDLYSSKMLAWRVDRSETAHLVQLAFADVFRTFGLPDHAWLDNGRGFASKWITGGQPTRYRFKVKAADPDGVLTQLGVAVHWTTPYSGQSKPVERAFRDLCDHIARHPAFEGAYTGNRPDAKPENYGSKAVPLDRFLEVLNAGIAAHNARPGRRTRACGGRLSFDQAFAASYVDSPIRKPAPAMLHGFLMAAERVTARQPAGAIHLLGNRYWAEFLTAEAGRPLTVRFDPDALHDGVEVYALDGRHLGSAECWEAAGFADVAAAKAHQKARRQYLKAQRAMLEIERSLSPDQVAALLPEIEPAPAPETRVLRLPRGSAVPKESPDQAFDFDGAFSAGLRLVTEEGEAI